MTDTELVGEMERRLREVGGAAPNWGAVASECVRQMRWAAEIGYQGKKADGSFVLMLTPAPDDWQG